MMDWPQWLALFLQSAPSPQHAAVVRKRQEAFRFYWEQGYSPDHAWQEEEQMGFGPIDIDGLPDPEEDMPQPAERPVEEDT